MVDEGGWGHFTCAYSGSPFPHTVFGWYRNDRLLREEPSRVFIHQHNGTVVIYDVQVFDEGDYFCEVNTTGYPPVRSSSAVLQVKGKLQRV